MSQDRQQAKPGLSVTTLMIASASSLAAAIVVSRLWGGGTLIGAAMTPVIVALVSEGLNRPARAVPRAVQTVRSTRAGRYDPVAEGRAGLREGDLARARDVAPAAAVAERRVHRSSRRDADGDGGFSLRLPKPRVMAAIATGLVAFVIAGVFLTSSELVLGKSVTSASKRTTFVPVHRSTSTSKTKTTDTTTTPTTSQTTTTPTVDTTTTPPAQSTPAPSETTPTAPPAQAAPTPAAPQGTTTPPATPAPTPAPQSAAPAAPSTTTP